MPGTRLPVTLQRTCETFSKEQQQQQQQQKKNRKRVIRTAITDNKNVLIE